MSFNETCAEFNVRELLLGLPPVTGGKIIVASYRRERGLAALGALDHVD